MLFAAATVQDFLSLQGCQVTPPCPAPLCGFSRRSLKLSDGKDLQRESIAAGRHSLGALVHGLMGGDDASSPRVTRHPKAPV